MAEVTHFERGPLLIWCGVCGCEITLDDVKCPGCGHVFAAGVTTTITKVDRDAGTVTVSAPVLPRQKAR